MRRLLARLYCWVRRNHVEATVLSRAVDTENKYFYTTHYRCPFCDTEWLETGLWGRFFTTRIYPE